MQILYRLHCYLTVLPIVQDSIVTTVPVNGNMMQLILVESDYTRIRLTRHHLICQFA